MAVKGSFFQAYGNLVLEAIETAQSASQDELVTKVEEIILEELDKFFPRVLRAMKTQKLTFNNTWAKPYSKPPPLSNDYYLEKQIKFDADRPDYFIGRHGLSKQPKVFYKKGRKKGQSVYDYKRSLYFKIETLAKNPKAGQVIMNNAGGLGITTKSKSGVDPSKGAIVDGKPKKYGARGGLVNARWQDIVSDEFLRLGRLKRARPIKGYSKNANPELINRPEGRPISLDRALAEGKILLNIQGSFFKKIKEEQSGFLNFLIKNTSLLKIPKGYGSGLDANRNRIEKILEHMDEGGRLLIDPVFGEVLETIQKRLKKLVKEVSSRG
ncbi:hypothetical protein [Pseudoalteromonas phage KB12-38]|nr:hypothetical protein [Pseudoalteromonas phage KB12-38]